MTEPWLDPTLPHDDVAQLLYGFDSGLLTPAEVLWGMLALAGQKSVGEKGSPAEWARAVGIVAEHFGTELVAALGSLAKILGK